MKVARHLLLGRVREGTVMEGVASVDPLYSVQWFLKTIKGQVKTRSELSLLLWRTEGVHTPLSRLQVGGKRKKKNFVFFPL